MPHIKSPALTYLEDLQRAAYKDRNLWLNEVKAWNEEYRKELLKDPLRFASKEDLSKLSPEAKQKFWGAEFKKRLRRGMKIKPPTNYEDPLTYRLIQMRLEDIKKANPEVIDTKVQFGSLPIGPINGRVLAVPNSDEYLIVMETELFSLCDIFSKVISTACPIERTGGMPNYPGIIKFSTGIGEVEKNLSRNREIVHRLTKAITAYLVYGSISDAGRYIVPEEYMYFYNILLRGMELFALGHEYGHIMLGHLKSGAYSEVNIAGQTVKEIVTARDKELDADGYGLILMINAMAKTEVDIPTSYVSAELFLHLLAILDKATSILDPELLKFNKTHPPLKDRLDWIRMILVKVFDNKSVYGDTALHSFSFAVEMERIASLLWSKLIRDLPLSYYELKNSVGRLIPDRRFV